MILPRSSRWHPCASSWTELSEDPTETQRQNCYLRSHMLNQSLSIAAYKSIVHCWSCSDPRARQVRGECDSHYTTGTNKRWPKVKLNLCHSTFCHPLLGKEPFGRSSCVQAENAGMVNKQRHIICEVFVLWSATSHHLPVYVCARPVSEKVFNRSVAMLHAEPVPSQISVSIRSCHCGATAANGFL